MTLSESGGEYGVPLRLSCFFSSRGGVASVVQGGSPDLSFKVPVIRDRETDHGRLIVGGRWVAVAGRRGFEIAEFLIRRYQVGITAGGVGVELALIVRLVPSPTNPMGQQEKEKGYDGDATKYASNDKAGRLRLSFSRITNNQEVGKRRTYMKRKHAYLTGIGTIEEVEDG